MILRLSLILAATALASASALAQGQGTGNPPSSPETKALVESCTARKFETTVEVTVDGKKRGSKVTLCGKQGQTDADWANTLKDAVKKIGASATMAQATKDQIVAALNTEILKVETGSAVASSRSTAPAPPPERAPEYSVLPPIPAAPAAATRVTTPTPVPAAKKPRLTIRCSAPGERGGGSACMSLERDTLLTIRADEDLPGGASLRFLRRGDARGEIAVAQMRQGQSLRSKLPALLCTGVASSKVEIQIMGRGASGTGQAVATLGPYPLRC